MFPLIIGNAVPEGDGAWTILMDLKEIVELLLCSEFTDESIQYLQTKIQDHRQMLQEVFLILLSAQNTAVLGRLYTYGQ